MYVLALLLYLASIAAAIFVIVEAFQDEIWKGILCLVCGIYMLYYALFELDHELKWGVIIVMLGSGAAGAYIGL